MYLSFQSHPESVFLFSATVAIYVGLVPYTHSSRFTRDKKIPAVSLAQERSFCLRAELSLPWMSLTHRCKCYS